MEEFRLQDGVFKALADQATVSFWIIDENEIIGYVNPAGAELSGFSVETLEGQSFLKLLDPAIAESHPEYMKRYLRQGAQHGVLGKVRDFRLRRADGEMIDIELKAFELDARADGKRLFAGLISDISARKSLERELNRRARVDALTGCLNRFGFFELASSALSLAGRQGQPLSLAVFDVDWFKQVNDIHGHLAGDTVLKTLSQVVRQAAREYDLLGRFGGEEFMILLPNTGASEAEHIAERARKLIEELRIRHEDRVLTVTASFGCASWRPDEDIDSLIARADRRLYDAKESGRNRTIGPNGCVGKGRAPRPGVAEGD